jgi:hypothetical protein
VNARYFAPVAFLLTIGVLLAADQLHLWLRGSKGAKWIRVATLVFVTTVAVCNGLLYLVEMTVARSSNFAERYETGLNMSLISAGEYLKNLPNSPKDGEIAVSGRYNNMNRTRMSPFALRVTALVTDRVIQTPRFKLTEYAPNEAVKSSKQLKMWLVSDTGKPRVKWYLYQPKISPWRVWHFRLGWYEQWQTGKPPPGGDVAWHLYRVVEDKSDKGKVDDVITPSDVKMVEVFPPQVKTYPTRVPGL